MPHFLKTTAFALSGLLTMVQMAAAQSVNERFFQVLNNQNSVEQSCRFNVRSDDATGINRRGYRVRLPNWQLTVATIPGTGITNGVIDQTFEPTAALLQTDQGAADVNCCVDVRRSGSIGTFTPPASMAGFGIVSTQAEQDAVLAVNADIKVVNQITWCNQAGNYAGCAVGGTQMVVNGFAAPGATTFAQPATIAHELGHLAGLCHVALNCTPTCGQAGNCSDCTDGWSNRVMYYRICAGAPNQGVITSAQCSSYQASASP